MNKKLVITAIVLACVLFVMLIAFIVVDSMNSGGGTGGRGSSSERRNTSVPAATAPVTSPVADTEPETEDDDGGYQYYGELQQGDMAPDFTATLADGGKFRLSDHKNEVVMINFWATWCPPCVGELPELQQIDNENIDGFTFIAVNCEEDKSTVDSFIRSNGYTFKVAYDENGTIGAKYPTDGIPYTLIIKNGRIEKIFLGAPRDAYNVYHDAIEDCLN